MIIIFTQFTVCFEENVEKKYTTESIKKFIAVRKRKSERLDGNDLSEQVVEIINSLMITITMPKPGGYYKTLFCLCQLLACFEDPNYYEPNYYSMKTPAYDELFIRISMIIEEYNGNISRAELEDRLGYTGDHLTRIIQRYTSMNFVEYAQKFSMLEAERLLEETTINIGDICLTLGYTNRTYFNQIFKKKNGIPPKEWRKNKNHMLQPKKNADIIS